MEEFKTPKSRLNQELLRVNLFDEDRLLFFFYLDVRLNKNHANLSLDCLEALSHRSRTNQIHSALRRTFPHSHASS